MDEKKKALKVPWGDRSHIGDLVKPVHWGDPQRVYDAEREEGHSHITVVHLSDEAVLRMAAGHALYVDIDGGLAMFVLDRAVDAQYVDEEDEEVV